ncbi:hypothetical protein EOM86_05180 [Candidatus Nomurabacteria bacterium]|nr:hypothetical protein [Candidatus Nomurabacteria bacterium]
MVNSMDSDPAKARVYMFSFFQPADQNTRRHQIKGRDVTHILSTGSQFRAANIDQRLIDSTIYGILEKPQYVYEYSEGHQYMVLSK